MLSILLLLFTEEVVRIKGQTIGTVSTEECVPPAQVFVSEENHTLLEPLFPPNAEAKVGFEMLVVFHLKSFIFTGFEKLT